MEAKDFLVVRIKEDSALWYYIKDIAVIKEEYHKHKTSKPSMFCIEVDRGEESVIGHEQFDETPTYEEILKVVEDWDCGYDPEYCKKLIIIK